MSPSCHQCIRQPNSRKRPHLLQQQEQLAHSLLLLLPHAEVTVNAREFDPVLAALTSEAAKQSGEHLLEINSYRLSLLREAGGRPVRLFVGTVPLMASSRIAISSAEISSICSYPSAPCTLPVLAAPPPPPDSRRCAGDCPRGRRRSWGQREKRGRRSCKARSRRALRGTSCTRYLHYYPCSEFLLSKTSSALSRRWLAARVGSSPAHAILGHRRRTRRKRSAR
eukprot:752788-Hanusia_phi.AAC.2